MVPWAAKVVYLSGGLIVSGVMSMVFDDLCYYERGQFCFMFKNKWIGISNFLDF